MIAQEVYRITDRLERDLAEMIGLLRGLAAGIESRTVPEQGEIAAAVSLLFELFDEAKKELQKPREQIDLRFVYSLMQTGETKLPLSVGDVSTSARSYPRVTNFTLLFKHLQLADPSIKPNDVYNMTQSVEKMRELFAAAEVAGETSLPGVEAYCKPSVRVRRRLSWHPRWAPAAATTTGK